MVEWLYKLLVSFMAAVDTNSSILFAAFIGSTVSVVAREERSFISSAASFTSGVFAGFYLTPAVATYFPAPKEALAAILAIMGRDLVRYIINVGRNNPLAFFIKVKSLNLDPPDDSSSENNK